MTTRRLLARGFAKLTAAVVVGLLLVPAGGVALPGANVADATADTTAGRIGRAVWIYDFDGTAMPAAYAVLNEVLDHVTDATRSRFLTVNSGIVLHIVPQGQDPTDLYPWTQWKGVPLPWDPSRTYDDADGLASSGCTGDVAVREEAIVTLPGSHLPPEEMGRVAAHEVGHEIQCAGLTSSQNSTLRSLYSAARTRYLDGDALNNNIVGADQAYTIANEKEFFAEATAAWFNMGAGTSTYRRSWLANHDLPLYNLLAQIYTPSPAPYYCNRERATISRFTGSIIANSGRDIIVGSSGDDTITAAQGPDVVCGRGGNDIIHGNAGDDVVYGNSGNDELHGDQDNDSLVGGLGDDKSYGEDGNDKLRDYLANEPGDGVDWLLGGPGDDRLTGGADVDVLSDTSGRDTMEGEDGNDILLANDTTATTVADTVYAGAGVNICDVDSVDQVFGDCSGQLSATGL